MKLTIELDRETDGRWIGEIDSLSVYVYGASRDEAIAKAKALALHMLADQLEHGASREAEVQDLSFTVSSEAA